MTCTTDIANLANDRDKRSLSLINIMNLINDEEIKSELLTIRENTRNSIDLSEKTPKVIIENLYLEQTAKRVELFKTSLLILITNFENIDIGHMVKKIWDVGC